MIQLSQFSTSHSRLIKDQQVLNCSPDLDLKVPITVEDEVSFSTKYSLMASINHSGTLDQGHYWAIVKYLSSGHSLSCNDKVVLTVPQHSLNNTTLYIIFYEKNQALLNSCKGVLFFLTLSLGVKTPHITPSPGRWIECAHSIFRDLHPCKTIVFMRSIAMGLTNLGQVFED